MTIKDMLVISRDAWERAVDPDGELGDADLDREWEGLRVAAETEQTQVVAKAYDRGELGPHYEMTSWAARRFALELAEAILLPDDVVTEVEGRRHDEIAGYPHFCAWLLAVVAALDSQSEEQRFRCEGCGDWVDKPAGWPKYSGHMTVSDDGEPDLCGPVNEVR